MPATTSLSSNQYTIGIVAIGRNEGERLRACLTSARRDCHAVVYVDSGSTDGSVDLAKSLDVHVVDLDLSKPFTAARARNEGFAELRKVAPDVSAVQFVDGDCEIVPGWLERASRDLASDVKSAVVCGRRRERFPDASVYNRLCDMEWDTPIGIAASCGGDALIRAAAFERVGGYDPALIAGEEPEMCVRLRQAGLIIHRIDAEMTLHDAAITRPSQWWKRSVRSGHAYAQGNFLHGHPPERFREREVKSIEKWAVIPILLTVLCVSTLSVVARHWVFWGFLPLLLYPLLVVRVAVSRRRRHLQGETIANVLLYATSVVVGKFPQRLGIHQFRSAQRRGTKVALIEYKSSPDSSVDSNAGSRSG